MRLHSLRLRALGPFAADQSIDFEQLSAGGLFLLDGPTGAGKSTVLDAITFALYGPGERGGDGRLHSHFAPAGVGPEVVLEFSVGGIRQRVTRSPEFLRPKRRGDGTTLEPARAHLQRWETDRWATRSSNKAEIGDILTEEIGLNREQFTQVVLLPQGEFMKFLRAGDDERRTLLTRLFGTQLYDRITDELERRRKVADADLQSAERRVHARVSSAGEAAGLSSAEQDALAALSAAERVGRCVDIDANLVAVAANAADAASAAQLEVTGMRERVRSAETQAARWARFAAAVAAVDTHERTRAQFEQASRVVAAADRAAPVRPLLEAMDETVAVLDAARAALPADAEPSADRLRARAEADRRVADQLTPLVAREQEARRLAADIDAANREQVSAADEADRLSRRAAELPALRAAAGERLVAARAETAARQPLVARLALATRRREAAAQWHSLEPRRAAATLARQEAFGRYETLRGEHLRLATERIANMAGELAAGLVAGQSCPVCGSAEHPAPATHAADAVSAGDVRQAEAAAERAEQHHREAAERCAELDQQAAVLATIAGDSSLEELEAELAEITAALTRSDHAAGAVPRLAAACDRLDAEAAEIAEAVRTVEGRAAAARVQVETIGPALAALTAELATAADGHPSIAARIATLESSAAQASQLAALAASVDAAQAAYRAAGDRARVEAARSGFASMEAARAALGVGDGLAQLRALAAEWTEQAAELRGRLAAEEFIGLERDDAAVRAAAAAREATEAARVLAAAETDAEASALVAERARSACARFAAARTELDAAQVDYDLLAGHAAPVQHLAKLARGMSGNRRVTLTTYVLRQWFEQVVAAANTRLSGMSSGRFELVRVDETGRAERTGLTLQVLDRHTGEQRSPRSLSGGETFYTSLALALGLADVVRAEAGGVELDTLFIDEGFGSLDADTLDQVMEVIDELRTRGRTVGIVSHVAELKHRVAERIEVRRLPDGSSTLRVVA